MKNNEKSQWKLKNKETKERGITLIALVVTIIILLILAGVAINLSVGDNGLFRKAQEAVNTYKESEIKENKDLKVLENELEKAKIDWSKVYDNSGYTPKTTAIETNEGTYYIPEGFKLADDSAGKISDGIVVEDKNGNQWVWVPCWLPNGKNVAIENRPNEDKTLSEEEYANKKGLTKYDRYAFSKDNWVYTQTKLDETDEDGSFKIVVEDTKSILYHHEAIITEQNESISKYGGFYIGRYETGDSISTVAKKMRESGDAQDNNISIKKNQIPYNYITIANSKTLATGMAMANGYNINEMFTVLISSYAWDTALTWIGGDYAVNSKDQGNYIDTTFNYTDIMGNIKTKNANSSTLVPTGQRDAIKNIYDMGGNLWEYSSELTSQNHPIMRGGYFKNGLNRPAGDRLVNSGMEFVYAGFRISLFLK